MLLFDSFERQNTNFKTQAGASFPFLNESARFAFTRVRELVESWFANYPVEHRRDLRGRFRSREAHNHESAFFELFLHELVSRLGCVAIPHPTMPEASRRPDFLVRGPTGEEFYLEAAVVMEESDEQAAARARFDQVVDALNDLLSPNFFLNVQAHGLPDSNPPIREIREKVDAWLRTLNPDEVTRAFEATGEGLPPLEYQHGGWLVEFAALPKSKKARGKAGIRTVGVQSDGGDWLDTGKRLRRVLSSKGAAYGSLSVPYVIAVNVLEHGLDRIDVMEALFGSEKVNLLIREDGEVVSEELKREPDGFWIGPSGAQNRRVSAVLISTVLPWSIPRATLRLYHNPWASLKYNLPLCRLPQAGAEGEYMRDLDGDGLADIMKLPEDWPGLQ